MNKKSFKILVFGISLFLVTPLFSQVSLRSFTHEENVYLQELEGFFAESDEKEGELLINELKAVWSNTQFDEKTKEKIYKSANKSYVKKRKLNKDTIIFSDNTRKLTASQKEEIYTISDEMLKKRMKPFPHFQNYIYTIVNILVTKQPTESFKSWQESVSKLISIRNSSKKFVSFLEVSQQLFAEEVLYESASVKWVAGKNYTFEFDELPKIVFQSLNLECYSKGDYSVIEETKGVFYPTEYNWEGEGGKVYWKRAGFANDEVYAEIKDYKINIKSSKFEAKNVKFYNKTYFKEPLLGDLEEKLLADVEKEKASYPRFKSYEAKFEIENILDGIDYKGGFSMQGRKIIGSSTEDELAKMTIKNDTATQFIAYSSTFSIKPDKITSAKAEVKFYIGKEDSIIHPGVEFKYILEGKEVSLLRNNKGISKSPYFNSYHKLDMYFEALYWKIDEPFIHMKPIKGVTKQGEAAFESESYYSEYLFDRLQGIDNIHPFITVKRFTQKIQGNTFTIKEYSQFTGYSASQLRSFLLLLASKGFLVYNFATDEVTVQPKLFHYLASKSEKTDYDILKFNSKVKNDQNAELNLTTLDLQMNGVQKIYLSDSQAVIIYPTNEKVTIKKNRNFIFDGIIKAGRMEFFGTNFGFDYNKFKINMPNVDSLRFKVRSFTQNQYGEYTVERVQTNLEHLSGDFLIDQPQNKSGLKPFAQFPVFRSKKDSYAYWDKQSVQNGVYDKSKFYFHLEPFNLDSVNDFNTGMIDLAGTFVSGGIFPDIQENLKIQPDYSLGFIRETPAEGYPLYKDKGTYTAEINLSNRGLRGDGTLNYLTSTSQSNDYVFFLDSLNALAQKFVNTKQEAGTEFPPVDAVNTNIHWRPYNDKMTVTDTDTPFLMYANDSKLHGNLNLTPSGMSAGGTITYTDAEISANLYKLKANEFRSDTADFKLIGKDLGGLAFRTTNVNAYINYSDRYGEFKANGGGEIVEFPVNQYISYLEEFKWFMDSDELELSSSKKQAKAGVTLEGAEFISIHPNQDSLRFISPKARYDLKTYFLHCAEVKEIRVADAIVQPDSGIVVIEKEADMRELNKAVIIANSTTKYHTIFNSKLDITSRHNYKGEGYYTYEDETGDRKEIYLDRLIVDTTLQTVAYGNIRESAQFTLSPRFAYRGSVALYANKKGLTFTGFSKTLHECENQKAEWFHFSGNVNPKSIRIPVARVIRGTGRKKVAAGVFLPGDSSIQVSFINQLRSRNVDDVIGVDGFLTYDKRRAEFQISTLDKLRDFYSPGNYMALNENTCVVTGEGKIEYGMNFGQIKLESSGTFVQDANEDSTVFDLMIGFNFHFDDGVAKKMADNLQAVTNIDPKKIEFTDSKYKKMLGEIVGNEDAGKMVADYNLYGYFRKLPDAMELPLFLYDVSMKWDPKSNSYKSSGQLGVGNIYKHKVSRYMNGKVQFQKKRTGDVLHIFIQPTDDTWYYFTYQRGLMQVYSSNSQFNDDVRGMKSDDRQAKGTKEEGPYQFMLGSARRKLDFLKKFDL